MAQVHPFLGPKLRYHREQRQLSLRDLSELSGVSYTLIGKVERLETNLSYQNTIKVAKALGIPINVLWDHYPLSDDPGSSMH